MKTPEEFRKYLDSDQNLGGVLKQVDQKRKANMYVFAFMWIIGIAFVAGMYYYVFNTQSYGESQPNTGEYNNIIVYFLIGAALLSSVGYALHKMVNTKSRRQPEGSGNDFTTDFKDKVIRNIISFCDPSFRYEMNNHVRLGAILASGMFRDRDYDIEDSDLVRGIYNGVSFQFSDVKLERTRLLTQKKEGEDTVFHGSMFVAEFNKKFKSPVFVYPRKSEADYLQYEGEEVRLESPEFARLFRVYSPDQIEARYILSTSLMARIEKLTEIHGKQLHFVFAHNNIYIANNNFADRFEASWFQSVNKKEKLISYYNELLEQLSIIDDLKLNQKIWG